MNPESTAIVWIDVDNEFLHENGKLYPAVKEVLDANDVVKNINAVNRSAREKGIQVIFIPILFSEDYREMGEEPQGIFRVVKDAGALKRGTWGARVAEGIEVREGDLVVDGKSSTSAFESTDLEAELRRRGISEIAVGGLLTNVCVESTMRSAYDKGFRVYAVTDGSATLSLETHEAAIAHDWPMFSAPLSARELIERIVS